MINIINTVDNFIHPPPTGKVTHTCNPNTWKVKAEESEIQGYLQLPREFEAILGYMKFCLKKYFFKEI